MNGTRLTFEAFSDWLAQRGTWVSDVRKRECVAWLKAGQMVVMADGTRLKANQRRTHFSEIERGLQTVERACR